MPRRSRLLCVLVISVFALGLVACSDDGGSEDSSDEPTEDTSDATDATDATDGDATGTVAADAYVADVCGSVTEYADAVESSIGSAPEDPSREETLAVLDELDEATNTLEEQVADAGVPEVADGAAIAGNLESAVDGVTASISDARDLADTLTDDTEANSEIGAEIESTLSQGLSALEQLFLDVPPSLQDAFDADSTCTALVG